jgi:DNA-binding Lrp family transcriptional regulator
LPPPFWTTELISSISGCRDPTIILNLQGLGFYSSGVKLTRTDFEILRSLRRSPRKGTGQLAEEVGVSVRTIERRLDKMIEEKAFFHMFRLDFQKSEGVTCSLVVSYGDERRKHELDKAIVSQLDRVIFLATAGRVTSQFNFICDNVTEAGNIRDWVEQLGGVSKLEWGIIREYELVSDWLDDELERMAE